MGSLPLTSIYIIERCLFLCLDPKLLDGFQPSQIWHGPPPGPCGLLEIIFGCPHPWGYKIRKTPKSKHFCYGPGRRAESFCDTVGGTFCTFLEEGERGILINYISIYFWKFESSFNEPSKARLVNRSMRKKIEI